MSESVSSILRNASEECEGANYHNLCGLPDDLYVAIREIFPDATQAQRRKLAKAIAENVVGVF